jgi:hypothetical protein
LEVTATVDDNDNGKQPIAAAVYSIDTPPWTDGADLLPLTPIDGKFDSSVESVSGEIIRTGLPTGEHILFVQGRDDQGNWGAVSAVFLTIAGVDWTPTDFIFLPGVLK